MHNHTHIHTHSYTLTSAPMWALAVERRDTVVACGAVVAGGTCAVVDVLTAVIACPAVHTHAVEATHCIVTCAAILAGIWG